MTELFRYISHRMPWLGLKMKQGGISGSPEQFVRRTFLSAFYLTTGVMLIAAGFLIRTRFGGIVLAASAPLIFIVMFFYFLRVPDVKAARSKSEINSEIVDAGRFLIVELESGVSLYDSFRGVAKNFPYVGAQFRKIVINIDGGTGMDDAITDVLEYTPSPDFRRILWQVLNSITTGSDVARGLKEVVDQISREHLIEVRKYGRKLNPLSMFYMIIAVIVPSLGIAMLVVLASLLSAQIDFSVLLIVAGLLAFVQFLFLAVLRSARPAINM